MINITPEEFEVYHKRLIEIKSSINIIIDNFETLGYNNNNCHDIFVLSLITCLVDEAQKINIPFEPMIISMARIWNDKKDDLNVSNR